MARSALITGITGQDGSYLAELLLAKGYPVHELKRRSSSFNTADVTGLGALRLFDAVRQARLDCWIYQASSSEMFGATPPPQREDTPFFLRSSYVCAMVFAYWAAVDYRQAWGMYISGILFNHESPRHGENFVTRKITRAVVRIEAGIQDRLHLGNLDAVRDRGFAPEYAEAMWLSLQPDRPGDYVVATGEGNTVRYFVEAAFDHVGLDWCDHVVIDPAYLCPTEVEKLIGDATRARVELGWLPKTGFTDLVRIMVDGDRQVLADERAGRLVGVDR